MEKKIKINDSVTIVNYGKIKHVPKNQTKEKPDCVVCEGSVFYCIDVMPHLIGLRGIVRDSHTDPNTNLTTYTVEVDESLMTLEEEQLDITPINNKINKEKLIDPEIRHIAVAFVREMLLDISPQQAADLYNTFIERLTRKS